MKERQAWDNRFETPTFELLQAHYNKQMGSLLAAARERLLSFEGVSEDVSWQGLPWRWTLVYTLSGDPTRAWAYLIPDPESPQVSMPLTEAMIEALPMRRLKKHVRDGINGARKVAETRWAWWMVANRPQLDDVLDIAKRKHDFLRTGGGPAQARTSRSSKPKSKIKS